MMLGTPLNIAVVEDHDYLRESLVNYLSDNGHVVFGADCAEALDDQFGGRSIDIAIIDLNLPGESGLSLSHRLRGAHYGLGIMILTARGGLDDRLASYDAGADIYLGKPVSPPELLAAVGALGRRVIGMKAGISPSKAETSLSLDLQSRRLLGQGAERTLSQSETQMLVALMRSRERCLESWQLQELLGEKAPSKSALEVRIARLRRKLVEAGAGSEPLRAVRGLGYVLAAEVVAH